MDSRCALESYRFPWSSASRLSPVLPQGTGSCTSARAPLLGTSHNQEPWTRHSVCLSCTEGCLASALPQPRRHALARWRLVSRRCTDAEPSSRNPPRVAHARYARREARPARLYLMGAACRGWNPFPPLPLDSRRFTLMGVHSHVVYRAWPQHNPKTPTTTRPAHDAYRLDSHVHSKVQGDYTPQLSRLEHTRQYLTHPHRVTDPDNPSSSPAYPRDVQARIPSLWVIPTGTPRRILTTRRAGGRAARIQPRGDLYSHAIPHILLAT